MNVVVRVFVSLLILYNFHGLLLLLLLLLTADEEPQQLLGRTKKERKGSLLICKATALGATTRCEQEGALARVGARLRSFAQVEWQKVNGLLSCGFLRLSRCSNGLASAIKTRTSHFSGCGRGADGQTSCASFAVNEIVISALAAIKYSNTSRKILGAAASQVGASYVAATYFCNMFTKVFGCLFRRYFSIFSLGMRKSPKFLPHELRTKNIQQKKTLLLFASGAFCSVFAQHIKLTASL